MQLGDAMGNFGCVQSCPQTIRKAGLKTSQGVQMVENKHELEKQGAWKYLKVGALKKSKNFHGKEEGNFYFLLPS